MVRCSLRVAAICLVRLGVDAVVDHLDLELSEELDVEVLGWHEQDAHEAGAKQDCLDVEGPAPADGVQKYCAHAVTDDDAKWT